MIDLVVAGGGPVGLAAAVDAAVRGLEVVVLEPRAGVLDKACGEGLMPGALALLQRLDVEPCGVPFHGIRYLAGTRSAEARFAGGPGRGVRRTALHAALLARTAAAGVRVVGEPARDVRQAAGHVEVAGLRARYLLAADGLHSPVRRELGLEMSGRGRAPARYGLRRHYAVAPWTDLVEVHWSERVEVYVTPVGVDEVGVAVLGGRGLDVDAALAALPALRDRLDGARPTSERRGAGPLRQRVTRRVAGRVLLVGDAAGYVDALTGEGLHLGLMGARAAVDAVLADTPERYEQVWLACSRPSRALTQAVLWASRHPVLRRSLVPAAAALPPVFRAAVGALAGG